MLSILIPTYNYNITRLVGDLQQQAVALEIDFEIIIMEDGSNKYVSENQSVNSLLNCKHIILPENIGRSSIRNRLSDTAQYPYLLFLDCDAEVCRKDFLFRYISCLTGGEVILIGGTAYDPDFNDPAYSLRLKYGRERESNLNYLIKHEGLENFATFNFLISKSIFDKVRFDENITGYGHEDTLFGHSLHAAGYSFQRIDNPLIHKGIDENKVFLKKTVVSVKNLYRLYQSGKYPFLAEESKLLYIFLKLNKYHLTGLAMVKFKIVKPLIEKNLTGKSPKLFLYDIYKLFLLCRYHVGADKLTDLSL